MRTPDSDRTLVLEAQKTAPPRREETLRDLYEKHKDRIYNLCYRLTGNGADAVDAAQATFCAAFLKIDGFRFDSRFSSWLYRIAVNACHDLRRRAATPRPSLSLDGSMTSAAIEGVEDPSATSPFESAARHETGDSVRRAVSRLSPRLRSIVALRYFEQLSYERISEVLGISLGTVKSRIFRAHEALSRTLGPDFEKGGAR